VLRDEELPALPARARDALRRYRLQEIGSSAAPEAAEAYRLLHAEFGAKGELEREEVVRGWLDRREEPTLAYRLLVARDASDRIVAVRDCHVSVDRAARICVVYLAHVLVLLAHRRTGLGGLLREVPLALGRRATADLAGPEILLAAEMEPVAPGDRDAIVRLVAYGRAGFRIVDPARLPYQQPDFRDHRAIDADRPRPVPMLAVVRRTGHENEDALPHALAVAYVEHLYRVFATHCRKADLAGPRAHALAALGDAPAVPLLRPPADLDDEERLRPLRLP
jgi:hypothetical protein